MNKERITASVLVIALFIAGLLLGVSKKDNLKFEPLPTCTTQHTTDLTERTIKEDPALGPVEISKTEAGSTNYSHKAIYVDENFQSNLPIIVIDTGNEKPSRGVRWDSSKKYYVPTGEDPYAYGTISIIDGAYNQVSDEADLTTDIKIKIRGNSSGTYDKKQYRIKTLNKKGTLSKKNILNMGSANDWILNISFADKSLMRNYLAFSTAKVLREETPDTRYCEVLWKENNQYRYDGVYLMMESVSVGENRVNLPQYAENAEHIPALYRRDRYTPSDLMLKNYSYLNSLSENRIGVIYPDQEILSANSVEKLTRQIDELENDLYSYDSEKFYEYRDHVDLDSFVDYFIINEFFLNYDAGYNSTYFFTDYDGKVHMGPVWDFDQAMDNSNENPSELYTTAFHSAPWFNRLLRDPMFTARIEQRYHMLRKSILSDTSINNYIDSIKQYLGPAVDRDWARWGYYYKIDSHLTQNGTSITKTWEDEVERIRYTLIEHAQWLDQNIDSLYQFKSMTLKEAIDFTNDANIPSKRGSLLAVVFVITFFVSVILVLRKESE